LYLLTLRYLIRIVVFANQDAKQKKAKLRPTPEDQKFQPHLANNDLIQTLSENEGLQRLFRLYKIEAKIDEDMVKLVYNIFSKNETYQAYVVNPTPSAEEHIEVLLALFKSIMKNEGFVESLEDHFSNWLDDKSLVVGAIKKNIKALPLKDDFYEDYRPAREATVDFGEVLIQRVHEEDQALLETIEPILKNWDADRVAVLDMILLKMALCELTGFPSVPTKVTLNEFVEISKQYSTDKSKDFINGILDRLMKKLSEEGKINKSGRGLIE